MADAKNGELDLSSILDDVNALKQDFAALLKQLQKNARGTAEDIAENLSDDARELYASAAAQGRRSVKALSAQVEEQPLLSLAIAFGIGFVGGRFLSR